jgi:hypothetical protein
MSKHLSERKIEHARRLKFYHQGNLVFGAHLFNPLFRQTGILLSIYFCFFYSAETLSTAYHGLLRTVKHSHSKQV